jgi:hypothetical protein
VPAYATFCTLNGMFTSISIQYPPPDAIHQEVDQRCLCTNTVNNENLKIFNQPTCDSTQNAPRHGQVGDAGANHAYSQVTTQPSSFCSIFFFSHSASSLKKNQVLIFTILFVATEHE